MALHWVDSEYTDGGSQISWEDGEHVFRRGWRLDDGGERRPALIVQPAADPPSRASLDRLAHEYELKDELDAAWAARPLDLVRDAGRTMLVLEDAGGDPLDRLLGAPMEAGRFLHLAIGIAEALGKLHQRGLVHKDIKPANILVNGATGEVRLTGFGIASRLPRERQSPQPPEAIAGTLAYMAPEQTGRMNRSIDSRSDLYALGIAFYRMLTGALPFTAADPTEWVHCHLARRPLAPDERRSEIPAALSAIVMKLLAKRAEDRFQTAAGLESDLRRCQTPWAAQRRIDEFPLGTRDTPDRLMIPEQLYGRRSEVESLLAAFERVVKGGAPELILVSGHSGIGKSAVVNELQPVLAPPRGLFAAGKFDQQKRDIPYATLAHVFQNLVRPLLAKGNAELGEWRGALREALGPDGQLVVNLVPDLKLIIGEQTSVPELSPQDAQRRFHQIFRRFVTVFARPERPLALFLDDLQWLDAATLDLLENLLADPDVRHVLLIGACRDSEVSPAHPLAGAIDRLRRAGVPVQNIVLAPLAHEHVAELIASSLYCDRERATPLAELVHAKTAGNPFFVIQFLTALVDEGLLTFDHGAARWLWDLGRIHAKGYTDNVIDLMVAKLTRLPIRTQNLLQRLACLGNSAELAHLAIVGPGSAEELHGELQEALQTELVLVSEGTCRFVHDRIREAAYSLIPESRRAEAHLRIGTLLATRTPPDKQDEAIFEIVTQLNRGAALITSRDEKDRLAELDLRRQVERRLSSTPGLAFAACWYWTRKLQARFFAGDYAAAVDASLHAQRLLWTSSAFLESAEVHFFGALSHAAACDPALPDQCRQHVEAITAHLRQLAEWAKNCPENFENRTALVAAEIARIENRELDAEHLYEAAIQSARKYEFVHNEALANELGARFHAARGFETIAKAYLREARSCYLRWGADGKVRQLEALHPHLRERAAARAAAATIAAPIEHLDYTTVMKVSQAVSGEMVLERLIDTLMRLAIEHAGAERSLLLLARGTELRQEAEAVTGADGIVVRRGDDPAATLPDSIVHYVIRTREVVILDDASAHPSYSSDPYVRRRHTRSMLCLPLINEAKVIGALYLENNLTTHVFTPNRVTVLKVLASQAAISLENSRLYRDLADREGRIRRLVDANVLGICIWNIDGAIVTANDEYLRMLQYGHEDVASGRLRWTELTPAEWRTRDEFAIAELRSTGTFQPFEKEYFRKDGSRLPVLIGGALFEQGGSEGVAFILDLTERKRAEEALRESERSLRSVMDGIPGLVGVLAPNGGVESVNRRIIEYCGQSLEELRNWGTNGTVHPEDLPHLIDVFTKSIAAGIPYQIEHRLRRFDGEYRWFDDRGVPIRDDAGRIACWYVLLTDIEDRTRAVARLQQMHSDFAHVNRVATLGQLSASIAHEVSQPITGAVTNASVALRVLRTDPPNIDMARGAIERIVRDCNRASEVVERVRALIKKAPARKDVIDVNEAIRETVRLAHGEVARRGVSVQTRLAGDLPQVEGDRVQLQQVILNLIINAAEAMSAVPEGSRHLTISSGRDGAMVLVAVQDSGPGIDPAHADRIFSAFYTTKASGLGMGLSISRSLVEAHGGRLWATNRPQGALFQLTLPERSESRS